MTVLFEISVPDMAFDYFPEPPGDIYCPECRCRIKPWSRPYKNREKKLKHDFQATYDGVRVTSDRAKDFVIGHASTEVAFERFFRNAYRMSCKATLNMNTERFPIERGKLCPVCGKFSYQLRRIKFCFFNYKDIDGYGIYFTDLCFGNVNRKAPLLMVGHELGVKLAENFPEIYLREVDYATN